MNVRMMSRGLSGWLTTALLGAWLATVSSVPAADVLTWQTNQDLVSADIQSATLPSLLSGVAKLTGWQVYLESNTTHKVSARFKNRSPGDALHMLLGDLNFALVPESNSAPRLYVFRTAQANATLLVRPGNLDGNHGNRITNELIVTLKPGVKIEDVARLLGAEIIGRVDALNTYRLQFPTAEAADAARQLLADNPDVSSVDSNYNMIPPNSTQMLPPGTAPDFNLKPKQNDGNCQVVVGVIDTPFQKLGNGMDSFLLPAISATGYSTTPAAGAITHGSAMAETILRSIQANTGGSTSVKILPVDVYGNSETTSTFDVAQGVYKAVNAGANVINMSLGSDGDSPLLHQIITRASQQGVIFFAAAGNEPVTTPTYPAAYPEVVGVTASGQNGQIAPYANHGDFVSIITPGTSIVPYDGQSYVVTGTSTATAYASGIAAGLADSKRTCPDQVVPTLRSRLAFNPGTGQ